MTAAPFHHAVTACYDLYGFFVLRRYATWCYGHIQQFLDPEGCNRKVLYKCSHPILDLNPFGYIWLVVVMIRNFYVLYVCTNECFHISNQQVLLLFSCLPFEELKWL